MRHRRTGLTVLAAAFAVFMFAASSAAAAPTTELISVSSTGVPSDSESGGFEPEMSADSRYVVFNSYATTLVPNDTNMRPDVFVRDRMLGTTERVSVSSSGAQGNSFSYGSSISADGRYVVFGSESSNLVPGDTNDENDIFVHDRTSGQTRRVDVSATGAQADGIGDFAPVISADGRYVAFASTASNLLGGHDADEGQSDIFRKNLVTAAIKLVSVFAPGSDPSLEGGAFSADISPTGRFVAFVTTAELVKADADDDVQEQDVYLRDRLTATTTWISRPGPDAEHDGTAPAVSGDGRLIAFQSESALVSADTNSRDDIYVTNRKSGATRRVSVSTAGVQGEAPWESQRPDISANGRYVVFESSTSNLVANDANGNRLDIFLRDRRSGTTRLISRSSTGIQGAADSYSASIRADGRFIAFGSRSRNLAPNLTDFASDVFLRGPFG